jgi:cytochrome c peroxidase
LAASGEHIYQQRCAACHGFDGPLVGKVTPIGEIATDSHRLDSYTYECLSNQNTLYAGYPWRFQHFRKTNGYANQPLDGIWLRAPYLHNGSVPTLRDLLEPAENRPSKFYRGNDLYDQKKVGFVSDVPKKNGVTYFEYDTSVPGNANTGHYYGLDLSGEQKEALVEYLKKL